MAFLLFLLQIAAGVVVFGFAALILSAVALTIRQHWTKKPE